jgi:hypothetical protein
MANSDPLTQLLEVINRCRRNVDDVLGPVEFVYQPLADPGQLTRLERPGPAATIRPRVDAVWTAWEAIPRLLGDLARRLGEARGNLMLSDAGRRAAAAEIAGPAREQLVALLTRMMTECDAAAAALRPIGILPRPQPADTLQLAELARLHDNWRLVLDRLPADDVAARLVEFARTAVAQRDELAVWALSVDEWPRLYVESRGEHPDLLAAQIGEITAPMLPADAQRARTLLDRIEEGYGLRSAVFTATHYVNGTLRDLEIEPVTVQPIAASAA